MSRRSIRYGFLSENAHFAEIYKSCDIAFIGSSREAMHRLGDKPQRQLAGEEEHADRAGQRWIVDQRARGHQTAHGVGFPVLIKATAGGGGRGMRSPRTT